MKNKGKFIVIDGTDGSGKATQTKLLVERLLKENITIKTIAFPQYEQKSSGLLKNYLEGKYGTAEEVGPYKASVFYAVDRYDASFQIKKWLEEGCTVISDRYVGSNMAHQGGKISTNNEKGEYFDWVYNLEYKIFDIPKPDINIILHVAPEISQKLKLEQKKDGSADIHEKDLHHLQQAEKTYLELVENYPEFTLIECVNSGQIMTKEEIHNILYKKIIKILNQ